MAFSKRVTLTQPAALGGAEIAPWYLKGGVDIANCLGAYQAAGAANLAASLSNLANPGTHDLTAVAPPTWNAVDGWIFAGAEYLITDIVPGAQDHTVIVKYNTATLNTTPLVAGNNTDTFQLIPGQAGLNRVIYQYDNQALVTPELAAGVLAMAGRIGYRNGVADGTANISATADYAALYIGARNNNGSPTSYGTSKIQAVAIYDTILTPTQIAAISGRLALPPFA